MLEHVKSHQDDDVDYEELSIEAKINVQCDKFVTKYFTDPQPSCPKLLQKIPHYPQQKVSISNNFTRITNNFRSNIHKYKVGHLAEKQCAKTWKIRASNLPLLDWENLRKEFRSRKNYTRFQLVKAIHRQWPVMKREKQWNGAQSDLCPLCKNSVEDALHVFQCNHPLIKLHRTKNLTDLRSSLQKYKTSPLITNHVCRILNQICGGFPVSILEVNSTNMCEQIKILSQAITVQHEKIGFQNMLYGLVTPLFTHSQSHYLKRNNFGRNYTADKWGRWFVRSMFDLTLSLWKYCCQVMHEKQAGTMENRLRDLAITWLHQLQTTPTLIPMEKRFLLQRSTRYFKTGDIRSIHAWVNRVELTLKNVKITSDASDIRKWLNGPVSKKMTGVQNEQVKHDESDKDSLIIWDDTSNVATRDLFIDSDSISTFPDVKIKQHQNPPASAPSVNNILVCTAVQPMEDQEDMYCVLNYKKQLNRNMIVESSDEESISDVHIGLSVGQYVFVFFINLLQLYPNRDTLSCTFPSMNIVQFSSKIKIYLLLSRKKGCQNLKYPPL